jgi:hypothetical protein
MAWRKALRALLPTRRDTLSPLAAHPLLPLVFDEEWYLARHPDVLNAGIGALDHFLSSGAREGRSPSPYVDLAVYAESLPHDRRDGPAAFTHLLHVGLQRGIPTSPFVDLPWYAAQHGLEDASPLEVFRDLVTVGRAEQRDPSPCLDLAWYSDVHPEIRLSRLDPFEYFLAVGRWLQRFPHPLWDEERYLGVNDYVRIAVGSGKYASGFEHFCSAGRFEAARNAIALPVRIDGMADEFSEERYLAANPDVAAAVADGTQASGVAHLLSTGHREVATGARPLKRPTPLAEAQLRPGRAEPAGDLLVLLVHFDVDGRIDPHVQLAVTTYRAAGADVVLITVGTDDAALASIDDHVIATVIKDHNDDLRDFGGWHHALRLLGPERLAGYARVILANDSVYFPIADHGPFLAALRASEADVFAATDSISGGRYHLQSYFLALGPRALDVLLPELDRRVAEQVGATKLTLIQRFEVGLSEYGLTEGLTTEVFCGLRDLDDVATRLSPPDPRRISRLAMTVMNLTHHFWRTSVAQGLPFLKVELLRDNPVEVDIDGWQQVVTGTCTPQLIETHLARVTRSDEGPWRSSPSPKSAP